MISQRKCYALKMEMCHCTCVGIALKSCLMPQAFVKLQKSSPQSAVKCDSKAPFIYLSTFDTQKMAVI